MNVNIPRRGVFAPQGPFISMGAQLTEYWSLYEANFPKLAQICKVLRRWPTTSTSLERTFSLIAAQYDKRRNRITCETLENLHNQSKESREFMIALRKSCEAEGISLEK